MNKIIKKLHKTLFSLACTSFAISIFSFSAGANVIAERDLLVNSALVGVDQNFQGRKFSTAAILSPIGLGFFVEFTDLREHMSWGVSWYNSNMILYTPYPDFQKKFKQDHDKEATYEEYENNNDYNERNNYVLQKIMYRCNNFKNSFNASIKFKLNNNFYLGGSLGFIMDITTKLNSMYRDADNVAHVTPHEDELFWWENRIFLGNKISIGANRNFLVELSYNDIERTTLRKYENEASFSPLLNLNIGWGFKLKELHVETRFSNFINFVNIKEVQVPAFTISANTDTSWAFLSFGAKTNLNFDPKNMMGFVQATVKL